MKPHVTLDGCTLTVDTLYKISKGGYTIELTEVAWDNVYKSRRVVEDIVASGKVVYGVNSGFGNFADVVIEKEDLENLQINLIRSHASGVGEIMPINLARMVLALRINTLAKGHSGISRKTLRKVIAFFNKDCLSAIPMKGSVGASGDLAPLSHLCLGMLGEGNMWCPNQKILRPAMEVIEENDLKVLQLKSKEGLAMINGTQFIVAIACEALYRARQAAESADISVALAVEALRGTNKAFKDCIHIARPHCGQIKSAKNIKAYLDGSDIQESHKNCGKVQDAYSLRCSPQVHGVVHDTLDFVERLIETEMNSATDNPMVFAETGEILSGGNFHGEYPAKALDYLAIAIHEISNISERRIERLVNNTLSGLPPFLVENGGLNSGFMIAHCTAAALVSENKTLCHPASVDSISTSAQKEDHVSMGAWGSRKCLEVVKNVEIVLAIEIMCSCQAIDFLRPLTTTPILERIHELVRTQVPHYETDRYIKPDIDNIQELLSSGQILECARDNIH
eukprot:TRINITY_DN11683_c0_g1_i1.p1 TRINITY_DN11683_c0_g1~~TRINITY_DN11683_c0_g1_i1.p1  ORF type:complete len:510 (+),score=118.57 TRINITY_DN11683_c0_g1_i1:21-1550(+)